MYILPLNKLIKYNEEYAKFFGDRPMSDPPIDSVDVFECNLVIPPMGEFSARISDDESEGWILLKNPEQKTYLLIHLVTEERKWNTHFVPDPKDILPALKAMNGSWRELFPLIRKAHAASHPVNLKDPPDLKYLERFITETYHHVGPSIRERILNS